MPIETSDIFTSQLPVGETFRIQRTRFTPDTCESNAKRISVVSGIHGDELEGQLVIFLLAKWLRDNPDRLKGTVDIYPAVNSLGVDTIIRSFPLYEVDLNRAFPGAANDFLPAQVVNALAEDVQGSDIAVDIHSSNIFLMEIPQIRINKEFSDATLPLAKQLNCDFIWIHDAVTVLEATFSHTMNIRGTKTLVVEMGVGMRLTRVYGKQLLNGLLNLMHNEGIIELDEPIEVREPFSSEVGDVHYINSPAAGLFVHVIEHCEQVTKGTHIGDIVDPLHGTVIAPVHAPSSGILFTLREYPVVYEGSLLARIFGESDEEN
jgi:predicted deacylase